MLQIEKEKPVSFFWMLLLRSFPEFFPALRCLSPLNFRSRNSEFHSRFFSFHLDSQWFFFASFYIYSNSAEAEEFKHQNPSLLKHLGCKRENYLLVDWREKGKEITIFFMWFYQNSGGDIDFRLLLSLVSWRAGILRFVSLYMFSWIY